MYEVQIQTRAVSMNAYGGWVTLHTTTDETEAWQKRRQLRDAARLLNRVGDVRITRDGVEVTE